jgi:hypothetical protein
MLETAKLTKVQNDGDLILLGPINPQRKGQYITSKYLDVITY